jgi:hypothetical protein
MYRDCAVLHLDADGCASPCAPLYLINWTIQSTACTGSKATPQADNRPWLQYGDCHTRLVTLKPALGDFASESQTHCFA